MQPQRKLLQLLPHIMVGERRRQEIPKLQKLRRGLYQWEVFDDPLSEDVAGLAVHEFEACEALVDADAVAGCAGAQDEVLDAVAEAVASGAAWLEVLLG